MLSLLALLEFYLQLQTIFVIFSSFRWNRSAPTRYDVQLHQMCTTTLPKNGFRFRNSENWCQNKNKDPRYIMCANFQSNWTTLNFLAQFCPKIDFGLEIEKSNVGIRIKILEKLCMPIFSQYKELWPFQHKFAPKWILGSKFQKSKSKFGISTSKIPCAPIFSQNGKLWIFRPKFLKIAQLRTMFWF